MLSKVHCEDCGRDTIHHKKDAGPWFYKVCEGCDKETLLSDDVWEEFKRNEVKDGVIPTIKTNKDLFDLFVARNPDFKKVVRYDGPGEPILSIKMFMVDGSAFIAKYIPESGSFQVE